ncbi:AzlC family ABC transporter permease [Inquilinus sp. CAU 1745]|uniref:AzlC family ABC transporter permease n=1 Tax=Inquilinus sp. CAU 1745 TaxID=3140369 RepID=UPI00325B51F0
MNPAASPHADAYGSPARAFRGAARDVVGAPALVLGASYVGFGSLVRGADLSIFAGIFSTVTGWALPGQIALIELYGIGASVLAIAIAVALTNVRLMPMTLALMPYLRHPGTPRWRYYAAAHLIAVTGWVQTMRRAPDLPAEERLPYLVGFSGTLWVLTIVSTGVGWFLAGAVPPSVSLGLVFLNPIYFMLVLTADLRDRARLRAMLLGALCGPLFHLISPNWGLLLTGLVAGTIAYLPKWLEARRHG